MGDTPGGGAIVEFHSVTCFPEEWFDLIVVLRCDNSPLFERLEKRGYTERKIRENVDAEIFQVVLDEAHDTFEGLADDGKVWEMRMDKTSDLASNAERVQAFAAAWPSTNV